MNTVSFTEPTSLAGWLDFLQSIHPANIELGLDRVRQVYQALNLDFSRSKIVLIGGTNGKGTTQQLLSQCLQAKGYSVGCYTSPHLVDYRERVTINGQWLTEQEHCAAFAYINAKRGNIELTFFEMATLAGLYLQALAKPDYVLLEVGLGGRLDATNVVEPDLSIITTIDIDHIDWLGDSREKIGFEKAGILRPCGKSVIGEPDVPNSVVEQIRKLNAKALIQGQDFNFELTGQTWRWQLQGSEKDSYSALSLPNMPIQNASTALAALSLLGIRLPDFELQRLFTEFSLPGRWQKINNDPLCFYDVAHNAQSCRWLADKIASVKQAEQNVIAVVGMLKDKAIDDSFKPLMNVIDEWHVCSVGGPRGADAEQLASALRHEEVEAQQYSDIKQALQQVVPQQQALQQVIPEQTQQGNHQSNQKRNQTNIVICFGSFYIAEPVIQYFEQ